MNNNESQQSSQYEDDFNRENEQHLRNRRNELDKEREASEINHSNDPHWMRCPKCGDRMIEFKLLEIIIDQCQGCNGLYFDSGELETLLEISDRRGFFSSVKKTFYN